MKHPKQCLWTFFISNKKFVNKKSLHFYLNLHISLFISCLSDFGMAAIFFGKLEIFEIGNDLLGEACSVVSFTIFFKYDLSFYLWLALMTNCWLFLKNKHYIFFLLPLWSHALIYFLCWSPLLPSDFVWSCQSTSNVDFLGPIRCKVHGKFPKSLGIKI